MRTRTKTIPATSTILCNRMLVSIQQNTRFIKVSHHFALFSFKHHCFSTPFNPEPLSNPHKSNKSQIDACAAYLSGFTKSVLDKCSDLLIRKTQPSTANASSLGELLLSVSYLNPRLTRKFWRKSGLEPQDVLELLLGFESNIGKLGIDVKKVESLFGVFKWASSSSNQSRRFKHLGQSFKIMVGLLVRVGLFKDAESLLLVMDKEGILLDNHETFSALIEWHVNMDELEKSTHIYDRMRRLNLSPSLSCYHTLLNYLVNRSQTQLLFRVYSDLLEIGISEKDTYENVIQALCRDGKVQESRNLIKNAFVYGIKPTSVVLDAIASGYCKKKDYYDLFSLFTEMDCVPDVMVGNKILHSMCQNYGVQEAFIYLKELEHLGFIPDAITFGILIGWSCQESNLKDAFIYLSNVLSRGLKPHIYSYNAIISGVFKKGMWNHAKDIVLEMDDEGITPDMSTFKVLLGGYCKARKFDEVKMMIEKMVHNGLIELSPLQDPISKAFMLLGINPMDVRVRRDNDVAFSKTEFYNNMGNGLYLEGDVVNFDHIMIRVLDDSMIPDYNHLNTIDELIHWGQELSSAAFLTLLKKSHASTSSFKTITTFLKNILNLRELDGETLNLLVQACIKRGFVHNARNLFDEMLKRNLQIENKTYSALVKGLCKKGNSNDLHDILKLVQSKNWLPFLNDYKTLICSLCKNNMLVEAISLFEHAMLDYPHEVQELFYTFLEKLCGIGFTKVAYTLFEELLSRGYDINQVAYTHLLQGLCKEKRFSEAFAFVMCNTMLTKNTTLDLDVDFYNVLLYGYCVAKDLRKVKEVVCWILKKNITIYISSYSKLVSLMCNEGQFRFRFQLWIKDVMVKQSSSHITVYNILIFHLFASGNSECVNILLDEIQEKGLDFDGVTYNFLVYGFSKCKNMSRALYYLSEMMSKELKPSNRCLRGVISLLSINGKLKNILKLCQEMEARGYVHCSYVQNEVVECLLKMNNLQEAVNFLDKLIVKDLVPNNINYDNLIKNMCRHGRKDKALDLLDTMLKKGNIPDSRTYDCLIQDLCVSHMIEEALDMHTEMLNMKLIPSIETHEVVTEKLCKLGRTLEAQKVIDDVICVGEVPSKVMFGLLVSRYHFERNFSKASEVLQKMQRFGYKPDFESHWSLISTLSSFSGKDKQDDNRNFLSRLLFDSGFHPKSK
ncbi:unnamed protein product [Lactuca virosa]|uniref:Pentacotripeptide-repeat region of PRORP domain-containing protein n=1 Tax=Lactuca virosa TaxID=75947 RepID=A0AAU9NIB7_9ASTR|nr:unnamed protein product [Lactuca virosa]